MKRFGIVVSLILVCVFQLSAQEIAVPVDLQLSLFSKILTYERNLMKHADDDVTFGIIYQKKYRKSVQTKNEVVDFFESSSFKIDDIPVRYITIDIDAFDLQSVISGYNFKFLYFTPLRAVNIKLLCKICSNQEILTLTGVPDYVNSGVSVGIGLKDARPQILINSKSAKLEGADFDSQLLKLSKIIN